MKLTTLLSKPPPGVEQERLGSNRLRFMLHLYEPLTLKKSPGSCQRQFYNCVNVRDS